MLTLRIALILVIFFSSADANLDDGINANANKENDIITEKPVEEPVNIPEQSKETPAEDPKMQETTTISTPMVRFLLKKS